MKIVCVCASKEKKCVRHCSLLVTNNPTLQLSPSINFVELLQCLEVYVQSIQRIGAEGSTGEELWPVN